MDGLKFGTSGLRGLVTELSPEVSSRYVAAFLRHLESSGRIGAGSVLVGRDRRDSSPRIAQACLAAASALGYRSMDCGQLPTPALALEAMRIEAPAIMVTGSHIPADRNGLKFYRPDGEITKADEAGITRALGSAALNVAGCGRVEADGFALDNYRKRYLSSPAFDLSGLKVGVYHHSSVASDLLVELIEALGAEAVSLGRSESFVPVDTEALRREDRRLARAWASQFQLDAIVSTDGDADRPLITDEHGEFIRGDVIGILAARMLGAETVVTPVTSGSSVELSGYFTNVRRTRVGSPFVIEAMAQEAGTGPVVGFEANGGVMLDSTIRMDGVDLARLPTRDAMLPILAVLSMACRKGSPVSALVTELPRRFTASDRLEHVSASTGAKLFELLSDECGISRFVAGLPGISDVNRTDGVRISFVGGDILHFRASGNAPELRCYAEASTLERTGGLLSIGLAKVAAAIGPA